MIFLEILSFPFVTCFRYLEERAPYHRLLLLFYIIVTILLLLGVIETPWFGDQFFDKVISLVLMWLIYPFIALFLEHKHSTKTAHTRARNFFNEHVEHLSDKELEYHLKQKH